MRRIQTIAGWLVMAAVLTIGMTACSNDDNTAGEPDITVGKTQSYTLRVEATKGYVTTRAIGFDGETGALDATWEMGDLVYVYSVSGEAPNETLSADPVAMLTANSDGKTTTLIGKFVSTYTPEVGARLRLKFLAPDYAAQDGTLDFIADNCDYATADVAIAEVDGKNVSTAAATFHNQQAIVKFTLKDRDTDAAIAATSLSIEYGSATYTVTPDDPATELYVAIPGRTDAQIKLFANVGTDTYSYKKTATTLENGTYYAVSVKMKREIRSMALNTVTESQIGWRIGSDGRVYVPSGKMPDGVTAEAMICYVNNGHHGYAIELNDSRGPVDASQYKSLFTQKAAVPGLGTPYGWHKPKIDEWGIMIASCNGETYYSGTNKVSPAACQAFYNLYNATGVHFNYGTYWTGEPTRELLYSYIITITKDGFLSKYLENTKLAYALYCLKF